MGAEELRRKGCASLKGRKGDKFRDRNMLKAIRGPAYVNCSLVLPGRGCWRAAGLSSEGGSGVRKDTERFIPQLETGFSEPVKREDWEEPRSLRIRRAFVGKAGWGLKAPGALKLVTIFFSNVLALGSNRGKWWGGGGRGGWCGLGAFICWS